MVQQTIQPIRTAKESVANTIQECSERSSEFRIFPRELSRETYALLVFACSVHCPVERVAEDRFRVSSMTEKGKTFSIKEGDEFRRVFKLMVKAFLPSPDRRMSYLKRAEQYAEACLSAVDEIQANNGSLPLISDILPTLNAEASSDQEHNEETAVAEKTAPKNQPVAPAGGGVQVNLSIANTEDGGSSETGEMTAERKIEAIQRVLGITNRTREELEQREKTIAELTERVNVLEAQTEELKNEKEQVEEAKVRLRREYDDYKLKIRSVVLD